MTDNDNILIERLFEEASRQQIADDGFTKRVMAALPDNSAAKVRRLSRLWTWFCILVGLALFFLLDGWAVLKATLLAIFNTVLTSLSVLLTTAPTADLRLVPAVLLVLLVFVLVVLPYQTARRLSTSL
jgi:hypothetical protein